MLLLPLRRLQTTDYDVYKSIPALRVNIFIMAVNPSTRYSNKAERNNQDIYDDFELNKTFGLYGLYELITWVSL